LYPSATYSEPASSCGSPSDGALTKTRLKIRRDALLTAKTVRILPTARAGAAAQSDLTETERLLVSIAVDRALCNGLSERIDLWSQDL
jgi:hypothetical protein